MNKKLVILVVILALIGGAIWYFQDFRNMEDVAKEQEKSIEDKISEVFSEDNDLFNEDVDFGDIEEAPLALDTTKAMK